MCFCYTEKGKEVMILLELTVLKTGILKEAFLSGQDTTFLVIFKNDCMLRKGKVYAVFTANDGVYTVEIEPEKEYPLPGQCIGNEFDVCIVNTYPGGTSFTKKQKIKMLGTSSSGSADLSDYYNKTQVDAKIDALNLGDAKNVQSDWNETDINSDAFIKNKPDISKKVSELINDSKYQTESDITNALAPYAKSADVTNEITAEVAKIVADAPDDFDTLKEMSDWIANHENDASAMNSAIQKNKSDIETLQTDKADSSDFNEHINNKNNPHSIPKATDSVDGLLSKEDHIKYEDSNSKKHEHSNKTVLDNTTASYTSEEKTKLYNVEECANKTIVDNELSDSSDNPVQNKVVNKAIKNIEDHMYNFGTIFNIECSGITAQFTQYPADWLPSAGHGVDFRSVFGVDGGDTTYLPPRPNEYIDNNYWFNVLTFGNANRCTQIAFFSFIPMDLTNISTISIRKQHDSLVTQWSKII